MNFRKVNNITGWAVFLIAAITYLLTKEATASFWDCGEFIASANEMGLPHPPGSPFFLMLSRFFIVLLSGGNDAKVASAVNTMSALASAGTILFLFWTITHFARKMYVKAGENLTANQLFVVMASGVVGGLAYTFSDSFWFSAVEGEVYALSSFFTALVVWGMLKWEHADELATTAVEKARADRWIVFIFYMMGISITVHLLNLLTIPAITMIYYFKRHQYSLKSAIIAFLISCGITGITLVAFVKFIPSWSASFDRIFVNSFDLPLFSGFAFFFILIVALCWFGLRWANKNNKSALRLGIWCFAFTLIGFSTYITTLERSNANPGIDMNNVDNPMSLAYYLGREQYGSAPLLYGPTFAADVKRDERGGAVYKEGSMQYAYAAYDKKYLPIGAKVDYEYESEDMMVFPRIWSSSNDQGFADTYANWLDIGRYRDQQTGETKYDKDAVTYGKNIKWFFQYQLSFMYWRYFMWNFAGKQNDIQGRGSVRDGFWKTGISPVDNALLGDQSKLPDTLKNNKANNSLFLLPFILGVIGAVYQFIRHKRDFLVTFLLFFFTGLAIVVYLNQPGIQPRERDYAYVGSFYAFAIWIGLAVVSLVKLIKEKQNTKDFYNTMLYGAGATFIITAMSCPPAPAKPMIMTTVLATVIYGAVTAALYYGLNAISSKGKNEKMLGYGAGLLCLIVPIIMAQQEWDDHDRSQKTLARDSAINYLESCAPNAILFTFGDNDTYPLWYAQEVEHIRPDIRIINNSLLGIDWYINQLRYKINKSDSIDVIWGPDQIIGQKRQVMYYNPGTVDQNPYYDLYESMKFLGTDQAGDDMGRRYFPAKKFRISVDSTAVVANSDLSPDDKILKEMLFEIQSNYLDRGDLTILNIIAANKWKRPVYFTSTQPVGKYGFSPYMYKTGYTYQLVPVQPKQDPATTWVAGPLLRGSGFCNIDSMYNRVMTKMVSASSSKNGVYYDEQNRRDLSTFRSLFGETAGYLADAGKKEEAKKVIARCEELVSEKNIPYAMPSYGSMHNYPAIVFMEACYKAGDIATAEKIRAAFKKDYDQQKRYYNYLKSDHEDMYPWISNEDNYASQGYEIFNAVVTKYDPSKADKAIVQPGMPGQPQQVFPAAADTIKDSQ